MEIHNSPKVFISYSHIDDNFERKMLLFADRLRVDGIDANIDLYEPAPKEGWPRWMENQIAKADFVLVVCNESYWKKCYEDQAKGVTWEVNLVYQTLYNQLCENSKFIPVFWNEGDEKYILQPLKSFTYYNIGTDNGYVDLWRRLLGIPKYQKPELGKINRHKYESLPEKPQRTMFFTTPIDIEKWNKAGWCGMLYMFYPTSDTPPVLGFLYNDFKAAKELFVKWKNHYAYNDADDFMRITFIIPPFPKDCYVYKERDCNYGNGYFVHVGANIEKSMERAQKITKQDYNNTLLAVISRFTWMNEFKGSYNREFFKNTVEQKKRFLIVPVSKKDSTKDLSEVNLNIGLDYALELHNVIFKRGVDIDDNDECRIVLEQPEKE